MQLTTKSCTRNRCYSICSVTIQFRDPNLEPSREKVLQEAINASKEKGCQEDREEEKVVSASVKLAFLVWDPQACSPRHPGGDVFVAVEK